MAYQIALKDAEYLKNIQRIQYTQYISKCGVYSKIIIF